MIMAAPAHALTSTPTPTATPTPTPTPTPSPTPTAIGNTTRKLGSSLLTLATRPRSALTGPPAPIPTAAPPLRTRARLTRRDAGFGFATAGYRASFDGALAEISYYWTQDQARFVLKGELESVRPTSALFQETGSLFLPDR